jgi:serine/threonine protein kinase
MHSAAGKYTHEVVTVWYRAPELLLGAENYSTPVDLWSIGCIIAEMAIGRPLFNGDSEIATIFRIFQLLGTPSEEMWPGLNQLPNFKMQFPSWPSAKWHAKFANISQQIHARGIDLVAALLVYDPSRRATAGMALSFFEEPKQEVLLSRHATPRKEKEKLQFISPQTAEKSVEEVQAMPSNSAASLNAASRGQTEEQCAEEARLTIDAQQPITDVTVEDRQLQGPPMKRLRTKSQVTKVSRRRL